MTGTGKFTISQTVAHNFTKNECLLANFFFSRNNGERDRAIRFLHQEISSSAQTCLEYVEVLNRAYRAKPC
jgi:hypothetical protein